MIKTTLRLRDFLGLFRRANPFVWFMGVYVGSSIVDLILGTYSYAVVMTVAVALGMIWVARTSDFELFTRVRDSALGSLLFGKRDSRVARALRRRSKHGKFTTAGFLTYRSRRTGKIRNLTLSIGLSRHERHGDLDAFGFVIANSGHEEIYRGDALIDQNGISEIFIPVDGLFTKATLNLLGPTQTFSMEVPEFEEPEDEPKPDATNPFVGLAAGLLMESSSSRDDVTRLRRKIALEIHPDRGPSSEQRLRSEALAWANSRLDRREARFA